MPSIPHLTDIEVGWRIRFRRIELRLSQQAVAAALGISFQQIQKYEKGRNRIAASRLVAIARLLDVGPEYFLDGLGGQRPVEEAREVIDLVASVASVEGVRLNRAFVRITDRAVKARIVSLIEAIGDRCD